MHKGGAQIVISMNVCMLAFKVVAPLMVVAQQKRTKQIDA
jgi:hypothetical protein